MIENLDLIRFAPCTILIGGPSGIGKTAIVNELVENYNGLYIRPISYTTRERRPDETNSEYIFVGQDDIYRMQERGEILTIDYVYGNMYAISRDSIDEISGQNKIPIKEVHPRNHDKIRSIISDVASVLLVPAGIQESPGHITQVRQERVSEDQIYYAQLDHLSFDVIMKSSIQYEPALLAEHLHLCIQSHLKTRHYFPSPRIIDSTNAAGYAKIAPEFNDDCRITTRNFHELSQPYFVERARRYITEHTKCLEIGVGHGWLSKIIPFQDTDYIGVDISSEMIKRNRTGHQMQSSVRYLDFPSGYFDVVIASLADPYCYPAALCEICRVLKSGGVFIFSTPSRQWSDAIRTRDNRTKTIFILKDKTIAEVYSFTFTLGELAQLLSVCGFSLKESYTAHGDALIKAKSHISPAIIESARNQGIDLADIPILNFVIARK